MEEFQDVYDKHFPSDDPSQTVFMGHSRLHVAAMIGDDAEVARLLSRGDHDPNARSHIGMTPAAEAIHKGKLACARLLLADPRVDGACVDRTGRTLAHIAVEDNQLEGLKLALASGRCDPEQPEMGGSNVLGWAAFHDAYSCVKHLCKVMDPKAKDGKGMTPLMHAAEGGDPRVVRFLLPLSDHDARGPAGETPLMHAAQFGQLKALMELLPFFDAAERDASGKNALDHVRESIAGGWADQPAKLERTERFLSAYMLARREMAEISAVARPPAQKRASAASRI